MSNRRMELWHPESPGMRVIVTRGWFKRLFYSKDFATLSESIDAHRKSTKKNCPIYERMQNKNFRLGFSEACVCLYGQALPPNYVREAFEANGMRYGNLRFTRTGKKYFLDGMEHAISIYQLNNLNTPAVDAIHVTLSKDRTEE